MRYEDAATRLEWRGAAPPSRDAVDRHIKTLKAGRVEACWHSAVSQQCRPLYPSKVVPDCHPDANFEAFRYLIDRVHELGLPIISWYSLNHCIALTEAHPEYIMQHLPGWAGGEPSPDVHDLRTYVCLNSPYREIIPRLAAEIVTDVGFDGLSEVRIPGSRGHHQIHGALE